MSRPFCSTEIRPPEAAHTVSGQGGLILVNKGVRSPPECDIWQFGNPIREMNLYQYVIMAALRFDHYVPQKYYAPIPADVERRLVAPGYLC